MGAAISRRLKTPALFKGKCPDMSVLQKHAREQCRLVLFGVQQHLSHNLGYRTILVGNLTLI
jgi:hypothetical protein